MGAEFYTEENIRRAALSGKHWYTMLRRGPVCEVQQRKENGNPKGEASE